MDALRHVRDEVASWWTRIAGPRDPDAGRGVTVAIADAFPATWGPTRPPHGVLVEAVVIAVAPAARIVREDVQARSFRALATLQAHRPHLLVCAWSVAPHRAWASALAGVSCPILTVMEPGRDRLPVALPSAFPVANETGLPTGPVLRGDADASRGISIAVAVAAGLAADWISRGVAPNAAASRAIRTSFEPFGVLPCAPSTS